MSAAGRFNPPYFRVEATALIFFPDSSSSYPDARLRVDFYICTRDDQSRSGVSAAEWALSKLGVSDERIKTVTIEVVADRYIAVDAKYVRNPDHEPVEAFQQWDVKPTDIARLVRQRRLVPDDHAEMVLRYAPKPAPVPAATEAVPA